MPPPLKHRNFKTKDSLFFYKNFYEKTNGIKKIGVYENLLKMPEYNELYFSDCIKSKNKLDFFKNENNKSKIEINKISLLKKNDSILFIKNSQNKIDNIDLYMSFSKVKFNKKYTKAIVFLGINYGALNGFSTLIYLEKKHYHWVIKCEKRLSIS
ncbi:hypothetical protein [Tenacibaculum aiptasiae]|uniref:hypothetical protein n=1 Tax=Tenacibaculum aiptasiae TaxID=426481 RepID=UPI003B5AE7C2